MKKIIYALLITLAFCGTAFAQNLTKASQQPYGHADLIKRIDRNVLLNPTIIGAAFPGMQSRTARWQIKKIIYASDNATIDRIEFCDGSNEYKKVWNDRSSCDFNESND